MLFSINFGNIFVSIPLDILDIEAEEDSDINELENFNINIQIYLAFKGEYKEFTVIKVNFNIIKRDNEEHSYNKDNLYFEFNNIEYHNII